MKVTIIGSQGMLGYGMSLFFRSRGHRVATLSRADYDILKDPLSKLEKLIVDSQLVINCTGIINTRIASIDLVSVFIVNGLFPKNLAKICRPNNIPCIHISTDCVYSGKRGNYDESDYYDCNELYGFSKNAGESYECMTLRTSIIGEELKNNYSLLEWAISQKNKQVDGYTNHIWNGLTTIYLAEVVEKIITQNLYKKGIFHLFSPRQVSKYELIKIINKTYKLNLDIVPTNNDQSINRSLNSIYKLSSNLVSKQINEQISDMYNFFRQYDKQ